MVKHTSHTNLKNKICRVYDVSGNVSDEHIVIRRRCQKIITNSFLGSVSLEAKRHNKRFESIL